MIVHVKSVFDELREHKGMEQKRKRKEMGGKERHYYDLDNSVKHID